MLFLLSLYCMGRDAEQHVVPVGPSSRDGGIKMPPSADNYYFVRKLCVHIIIIIKTYSIFVNIYKLIFRFIFKTYFVYYYF